VASDLRLRLALSAQDDASKKIKGIGNSITDFAKGVATGQLAVDGLKYAFNQLKGVLDVGIQFEQTQVAFETMMGSAEQGQAMLRDLYAFAAETPFEIPGVLQSSRELLAMGVDTTNMIDTLTMLGDIASGVGTERLGQLTLAYGQVQTATKLTGMELRQFTEAGVPLLESLADITGISAAEIKKKMEAGMIVPAELVTKALENMTQEGGKFFELMAKQSRTLGGAVSNLKDSVTLMSAKIGTLASSALGPLVNKVAAFIKTNGNVIISFITAAIAITTFIVVVKNAKSALTGLWTIIKLIPLAMSPLFILFALLAAVLGGVVYRSMKKFMDQIGKTTDEAVKSNKAIGSSATDGLGEAAKAAEDLADKLKDISDQALKSERDFKESLAKIVQDTKANIKDLEKELSEETDAFNKENEERIADFTNTQKKLEDEHAKKVAEIQAQIDEEVGYGWLADQERLNDLRAKLMEENSEYDTQFAENKSKYEQDTSNAKTEYEKKKSELQIKLEEEKGLLERHSADVLSIQNVQLGDEIDNLKRSHAEQMAEYDKQRDAAIKSAKETTAGISASYNNLVNQIDTESFDTMGEELGKDMGEAFKDSFKQEFIKLWKDIKGGWEGIKTFFKTGSVTGDIARLGESGGTGWNTGGIIHAANGFRSYGTDTVPAMLTPGEMVLNSNQQQRLWNMANGNGGGGVTISNINIYGNINNKDGLSPEEIGNTIGRQITLSRQGAY
jgi:tape measure domain-containing protein